MKEDGSHWLGRAGFVAKGVLYGIVGAVAIAVAVGSENRAPDQTGALSSLADGTLGKLLLALIAAGLGALALFRLLEAYRGPAAGMDSTGERLASLARAVVYGGLCFTALDVLIGGAGSSGNEKQSASTVFDLPGGVILVLGAGAVLVGVGLYQAYRSATDGFEEDLRTGEMGPAMRRLASLTGVAGHAARAVIYVLVGGFLVKAAVEHDSQEAIGLDGALQELSQQPLGPLLLFLVAAGLFIYGAYSLIESRYHDF